MTHAVTVENIRPEPGVENDLPRFCLEPDVVEAKRLLAWVNSICLAYLIIGIIGLQPRPIVIQKRAVSTEDAVPAVIEPLLTPVQAVTPDSSPDESTDDRSDGPAVVAVTVDSPAVAFSVPTVGNVLVALNAAAAPPANPMKGVASLSLKDLKVEGAGGLGQIENIGVTGIGGSRPPPNYPRESLMEREQGTVLLQIEVDDSGKVVAVTVQDSSGHMRLDRAAADHVKRHWFFELGKGKRLYHCPIVFQLQ